MNDDRFDRAARTVAARLGPRFDADLDPGPPAAAISWLSVGGLVLGPVGLAFAYFVGSAAMLVFPIALVFSYFGLQECRETPPARGLPLALLGMFINGLYTVGLVASALGFPAG